jgi:5-methylcytosine-specific restriction enzyme subunit McrC
MNRVITVRESFDWLVARPGSSFTESDLQELLLYLAQHYPDTDIVEIGLGKVRFINYVGTIQLTQVQIDIIPKLHVDALQGRAALVNMLTVAGYVPYMIGSKSLLQVAEWDILEFIAWAFVRELYDQIVRGMAADYQLIEENIGKVKGKILTVPHFRNNFANRTKVYCGFHERTIDIPLNRMFKCALEYLRKKIRNTELLQQLKHVLSFFDEVSPIFMVDSNLLDSIKFDRQNRRFEGAYELAKLILSRMSVLNRSGSRASYSILFEVNRLYETYIGKAMRSLLTDGRRSVYLQHDQVRLLKNDDTETYNIQLIPDIVVGEMAEDGNERWTTIMDTKWKLPYYQQDDLYQMYAYVTAYPDAQQAILLYPRSAEAVEQKNWSVPSAPQKKILVRTVRVDTYENTLEDLQALIG